MVFIETGPESCLQCTSVSLPDLFRLLAYKNSGIVCPLRVVHSFPALTSIPSVDRPEPVIPCFLLTGHDRSTTPTNLDARPRSPTPNRVLATVSEFWTDEVQVDKFRLNDFAALLVTEIIQCACRELHLLEQEVSGTAMQCALRNASPQPTFSSESSAVELKWFQSYSSSTSVDILSSPHAQTGTPLSCNVPHISELNFAAFSEQIVDEVIQLSLFALTQHDDHSCAYGTTDVVNVHSSPLTSRTQPALKKQTSEEETHSVPCASHRTTHSLADDVAIFSSTLDVCSARCFSEDEEGRVVTHELNNVDDVDDDDDRSPDVDMSTTSTVSLSSYLRLQTMSSDDNTSGSSARPTSPRSVHLFWSQPPGTRCELDDFVVDFERPETDARHLDFTYSDRPHPYRRDRGRIRERHPRMKRASRSLPMEYSFSSSSSGDRLATLDQLMDDETAEDAVKVCLCC